MSLIKDNSPWLKTVKDTGRHWQGLGAPQSYFALVDAHLLCQGEGGLETRPADYIPVNPVSVVDRMQAQIRKAPFCRVEAVTLVDEVCLPLPLLTCVSKNCLSSIYVAGPFIEHKNSGKVSDVKEFVRERFRQVVDYQS